MFYFLLALYGYFLWGSVQVRIIFFFFIYDCQKVSQKPRLSSKDSKRSIFYIFLRADFLKSFHIFNNENLRYNTTSIIRYAYLKRNLKHMINIVSTERYRRKERCDHVSIIPPDTAQLLAEFVQMFTLSSVVVCTCNIKMWYT